MSLFVACGPAAESRDRMDALAIHMSDSIARGLDSALADPAKEAGLLKPQVLIGASSFTTASKP